MLKSITWVLLSLVVSSPALAQFQLDGIYQGMMKLYDGEEREIPLDLSLVLTGETDTDNDGNEYQIIDGSFVVDEEGGPYSFSKVSFDIEDARIDMRYNRPQLSTTSPSSFRLVGYFLADGTVEGRVLSGVRGPIGTFTLGRVDEYILPLRDKYNGAWAGEADLTDGGTMPFEITLTDALVAFTNPPNYEFEYTPGKIGNIRWNRTRMSIDDVSIDYLRRRIVLHKRGANGSTELSVEFAMDFTSGKIAGQINSVLRGRTATFLLEQR